MSSPFLASKPTRESDYPTPYYQAEFNPFQSNPKAKASTKIGNGLNSSFTFKAKPAPKSTYQMPYKINDALLKSKIEN